MYNPLATTPDLIVHSRHPYNAELELHRLRAGRCCMDPWVVLQVGLT